jgi:hypothetical protein
MTNKTLYVQDRDLPLWERADRAAKQRNISLSALVGAALTRELTSTDTIQVQVHHTATDARTVAFEGRWLTNPHLESNNRDGQHDDDVPTWDLATHRGDPHEWIPALAETARGRIVLYIHHWNYDYDMPTVFEHFGTLEQAQGKHGGDPRIPTEMWTEARNALHGVAGDRTPIEFLEI